jgi:hypothetical protein
MRGYKDEVPKMKIEKRPNFARSVALNWNLYAHPAAMLMNQTALSVMNAATT